MSCGTSCWIPLPVVAGIFGGGLGAVEITVALHYVFNTPHDRIVWDVGHQCYPHKILTGRKDRITTIRTKDGLAPFPKRSESEHDHFGTGHSSTSIGAALGMAIASAPQSRKRKVIAVIGDGGITGGMAYEALNHLGDSNADLLVILNDNENVDFRPISGPWTKLPDPDTLRTNVCHHQQEQ